MKKTKQNYEKRDNLIYGNEFLDQKTDFYLLSEFINFSVNGQKISIKRNPVKFPLIFDQIDDFKLRYKCSENRIKIKNFNPLKQWKLVKKKVKNNDEINFFGE